MVQQELDALVPRNIVSVALVAVILFAGLAALVLWVVRSRWKERLLLWVAVLALIYGLREAVKNPLIQLTFGITRHWCIYFVSWVDFSVLVPAALLLEEVFGHGWRHSLRWGVWVVTAYGLIGITAGLISGDPYYLREPSGTILFPLIVGLVLLNLVKRYRPSYFADVRIFLTGLAVFSAFVIDNHLLPERFHAEPLGFLAFICSLVVIAVRRGLRNETRLIGIEQELASARRIQASILPVDVPRLRSLTIAARYSPMSSVAGDFYDFAVIDSVRLGVLIADVAGHGVPAALIASMVKVAFAAQQPHAAEPGLVLAGLNQIFCSQLRGHYVTAGYLLIDEATKSLLYSGAGHPPLIVWRAASQKVERHEKNGLFLGLRSGETYPTVELSISPGDRLILYTDGLLEATNQADESFAERLDVQIAAHRDLPAALFVDSLLADLRAWTSGSGEHRQEDDLTLLVVDVSAIPGASDLTIPLQTALA
jgi:phosphoserine phosphatase RsbU/P